MAEVYWIHLPEHTDMFSEGYVGFSSKTAVERFKWHVNAVKGTRSTGCHKLIAAMRKHGVENVILDVLCICDNEYGLWLENKLRPTPNIGWNIACGGAAPMLGSTHTAEAVEKQRQSWKRSVSREQEIEMVKRLHARRPSKEVLQAAQQKIAHQRRGYKGQLADHSVWVNAEIFYAAYLAGVACKTVEKFLRSPSKKYVAIYKEFKSGWVPSKDAEWLLYKEQNISVYDPAKYFGIDSLGSPKTRLALMGKCNRKGVVYKFNPRAKMFKGLLPHLIELFDITDQGNALVCDVQLPLHIESAATASAITPWLRRFRGGWNPRTDEKYLEWLNKKMEEHRSVS